MIERPELPLELERIGAGTDVRLGKVDVARRFETGQWIAHRVGIEVTDDDDIIVAGAGRIRIDPVDHCRSAESSCRTAIFLTVAHIGIAGAGATGSL